MVVAIVIIIGVAITKINIIYSVNFFEYLIHAGTVLDVSDATHKKSDKIPGSMEFIF